MRCRLCNLAAAVSLVLCVATVVLWVRSYWRGDSFSIEMSSGHERTTKFRLFNAASECGSILLHVRDRTDYDVNEQLVAQAMAGGMNLHFYHKKPQGPHRLEGGRFLGLQSQAIARVDDPTRHQRDLLVLIPNWFTTIVLIALPLCGLLRWLHAQRAIPGRCSVCGYDLRASLDRCPECGKAPDAISN